MLTTSSVSVKWSPLSNSTVRMPAAPGWVFQLTHNGTQTLGVWTNGRSVFTVLAAQA